MLTFKESTPADMQIFQIWSESPAINRWVPIEDWTAYYQSVSNLGDYFLYSIYSKDELVGFIAAEINNRIASILLIVAPERQGQGIGNTIIRQLITEHSALFGDVTSISAGIFFNNYASIRCFEKAGFRKTDIGKDGEIIYTYMCGD